MHKACGAIEGAKAARAFEAVETIKASESLVKPATASKAIKELMVAAKALKAVGTFNAFEDHQPQARKSAKADPTHSTIRSSLKPPIKAMKRTLIRPPRKLLVRPTAPQTSNIHNQSRQETSAALSHLMSHLQPHSQRWKSAHTLAINHGINASKIQSSPSTKICPSQPQIKEPARHEISPQHQQTSCPFSPKTTTIQPCFSSHKAVHALPINQGISHIHQGQTMLSFNNIQQHSATIKVPQSATINQLQPAHTFPKSRNQATLKEPQDSPARATSAKPKSSNIVAIKGP